MSQVISHARVAFLLLIVCCWSTQTVLAQIAPTNSATISGSISDSTGKPVAHATVSLSGPKSTSTQTDAQGLFVFVGVPFGTYSISAAATGLGTAIKSVSVQSDVNVAIQYEAASLNGLKVIANVSSSATAQFNVTPASITQVNPMANAFEGKTSWRTILEQIPGVAQAGLLFGSVTSAALPDSPMVPMQISINGALPYETATLLDDMPLIGGSYNAFTGSGTDLSLYPLNGFSSADVVRGPGADAPSIVDSVGGSFVLHAPGIVNQTHYDISLSTDPYGGIVTNALAAVRWNKLSAEVTYGVNDSPGPLHSAQFSSPGAPIEVNGESFACVAPCSSRQALYDNSNYAPDTAFYGYQVGLLAGGTNYSDAWNQHSGSLELTYTFSPSVYAQVFYAGMSETSAGLVFDQTINFVPPVGYVGAYPSGQSFLPYGVPDQFLQQSSSLLEEKFVVQIGRGELRLEALQNRDFDFDSQYILPSTTVQQLYGGGTLCITLTPACGSAGNPGTFTIFNGGTYNVTYSPLAIAFSNETNNRDFLLNYTTPLGENFYAGASFVNSFYNMPTTSYLAVPSFSETTTIPSAISQMTNELRFFVGGNLSEKTSLDLSMYFVNANYHVPNPNGGFGADAYSCPGGVFTIIQGQPSAYVDEGYDYAAPRLGFVWRPTAAVAVRASAGGGFAEAPLNDLVGSNGAPFCSSGICSTTLTNVNLQPEKSFGFDLGTDIKLPRNTVLSFDVYHTNLYGQLYESTATSGSCPSCGGLPLYVTQYGNLGESRYEGILVDVRHTVPHGAYWSLSGGLTRGFVVSVPAGFYNTAGGTCVPSTGANCTNLYVVPNINFNGYFSASIPYAQGLGIMGYRWNDKKYVELIATYYGNNNTYFRPAFVEFDGNVGYPLTKTLSLLVTFRNITGIYDGSAQIYTPTSISGVPAISGLPYPLYGEEYGPRTVLFTMNAHL